MRVFDSLGNVTLDDSRSSFRLYDSGFVSNNDVSNTGIYSYTVNIGLFATNLPYLFTVKSDFDTIVPSETGSATDGSDIIKFGSDFSGPKEWKLYTPFYFENYSTSTNYGIKMFTASGDVAYDSRVKEAKLVDFLQLGDTYETYTHNPVSPAWYAINTFPVNLSIGPGPGGQGGLLTFLQASLKQISSTETTTGYAEVQVVSGSVSSTTFNPPYPSAVPIVVS